MPDEVIIDNDAAFAASVWDDKPAPVVTTNTTTITEPVIEEKKPEETVVVEEKKPDVTTEIFDANQYVKDRFGFETEEQAIEQLRVLRENAQTPAEHKFANEKSRQYYEAITGDKEDEIYKHLYDKKQLERAEKMDLTKASDAAEVLRLAMHYKYPDLSPEDIHDHFQEAYVKPAKPEKTFDQEDADYKVEVSKWEQQCEAIDKRIIREAKMAKPELAKYKSELILPKIEEAHAIQTAPSQEDLAKVERDKQEFFQQVDKGVTAFKGYSATYKDKDVEITSSYDASPEEKAKVKPIVESLFSDFSYFGKRWANKDGSWNTALMAEDIHNLENRGSINQKFVNDAAAKMLDHMIKTKKNLHVTGPSNPVKIEAKDSTEKFEEAVWS
jgi:hypothetical protein